MVRGQEVLLLHELFCRDLLLKLPQSLMRSPCSRQLSCVGKVHMTGKPSRCRDLLVPRLLHRDHQLKLFRYQSLQGLPTYEVMWTYRNRMDQLKLKTRHH